MTITKFIGKIEFGANISIQDANGWLEAVREQLPDGTYITLKQEPLLLDVAELTDAHAGEKIKVYVNKNIGEITGKLEHVYVTGRSDDAPGRTLVIDGHAYPVTYGVAQLSEW